MKLTICGGPNTLCCTTDYLDSPHDDFHRGDYNIFTGETLGDCYQFLIETQHVTSMQIHHEGFDGVDIEYWEIFYDDGAIEKCDDGHFYDRDDTNTIACI